GDLVHNRCNGDILEWCDMNDRVAQLDCTQEGMIGCEYIDEEYGYGCAMGSETPFTPTPCGAVTAFGECEGARLRWCDPEEGLIEYDCAVSGGACALIDDEYGYDCVGGQPDPECAGMDALGRCNGAVAEWCELGVFQSYDCAEIGQPCAFIDAESGYFCAGM
ncbi:hypothetical protein KJ940_02755, partial [Myxococcota bacterium]|nr:hypothetical protein [Myxococcota bacterium]